MRRFSSFLLLALFASVAGADEYVSPAAGGPGGLPYSFTCPSGKVLIGIKGGSGALVDRLTPLCQTINVDGTWSGSATDGTTVGGGGGSAYDVRCPTNHAVAGIAGRAGPTGVANSFVNQIAIGCKPLTNYGQVYGSLTMQAAVGGTGGNAFGTHDCGVRPGKGFRGRAYGLVDQVSLVCDVAAAGPALLQPEKNTFDRSGNPVTTTLEYPDASGVTFSWFPATGASKYKLCISRVAINGSNCNFTSVSSNDTLVTDVTTTSKTALPAHLTGFYGKNLQWAVIGMTAAGGGSPSEVRNLIIHLPSALLTSPNHDFTAPTKRPTFKWATVTNATGYRLRYYLLSDASGTANDLSIGSATEYTPATDLASGKIFWMINACNTAGCGGTGNMTAGTARYLTIPGTTTNPTVSWATHLHPRIANSCLSCHPGTSMYPQSTTNRVNDAATTCNELLGIPFDAPPSTTAITAAEMLARFKCSKAMSGYTEYSQAYGKVYVVPNNSALSGLHHKAWASTAAAFTENVTINNVTKQVREWITLWIDQGANP